MRYSGSRQDIESVENEINRHALSFIKSKLKPYDNLFGIPSIVEAKVFEVIPRKEAYLFPVRFFYDNRNGEATLDIHDKDLKCLLDLSPNMGKLIMNLTPQRQEASR